MEGNSLGTWGWAWGKIPTILICAGYVVGCAGYVVGCGGYVVGGWGKIENKAKLSPAKAGARAELGKSKIIQKVLQA